MFKNGIFVLMYLWKKVFDLLTLKFDDSKLQQGMDSFSKKVGIAVLMFATTKAKQLESTMKSTRPWTDRTNMAKATLTARVSQPDIDKLRITLAHGVEYGIWLELANESNYAIIIPTIRNESPKVFSDLDRLFDKLNS